MSLFGLFGPPNVEKLKTKGDVQGLIRALAYQTDSNVRRSAALALGQIGGTPALGPLLGALKDEKEDVRTAAAEALGKIRDLRATGPLVLALEDSSVEVRQTAAMALGKIRDVRAIEPLVFALDDEFSSVREAAAWALVEIGVPAINLLQIALKNAKENVRIVVADILSKISIKGIFDPLPLSITTWHEDTSGRIKKWETLDTHNGCAFDFIASSTILEWLAKPKTIKIDEKPDYKFQRYRDLSRLVDERSLIHQLVLFDKVYLNIGMSYKAHADLSVLQSYGFFEEYPKPPESRFLDAYRLIRPLALEGIFQFFRTVMNIPYDTIWTDNQAKATFRSYTGLLGWLYDEYAKDACGLETQELALFALAKRQYVEPILDFMEYAVHAQGCLAAGNLPMFSSILRAKAEGPGRTRGLESIVREDTFALYQVASKNVLGHYVALDSFEDVLRLRDDRSVTKVRQLLSHYFRALNESDEQIVKEIVAEIVAAKKALDVFDFTENPAYSFVVKPLSYLPGVGTIVNMINDAVDLAKAFNRRKNGWIYFGLK